MLSEFYWRGDCTNFKRFQREQLHPRFAALFNVIIYSGFRGVPMELGSQNRYERIFIVQMYRIGDVVQSLPLLQRLKEDRSPCEITLLCTREVIELIHDLQSVDRFVSVPCTCYKTIHGLRDPSPKFDSLLRGHCRVMTFHRCGRPREGSTHAPPPWEIPACALSITAK